MPYPKQGESKENYVARFMGSEEAKKDYPDEKQRLAIAYSIWKKKGKGTKEDKARELPTYPKLREESEESDEEDVVYFYGATTLPIRKSGVNYSGDGYDSEVLTKDALDDICGMINDESKMGGGSGSWRTISLFHDRVYAKDPKREEAGFVIPHAVVEPLKEHSGHFGLKVPTKVNKFYVPPTEYPDYTAEKISYKIDNGALGLSIEYDNEPKQERLAKIGGKTYNVIEEITDFRGFGYARPNMIADTASVRIREVGSWLNNQRKGETQMDEKKMKEVETKLRELEEKNEALEKELETAKQGAEEKDAEEKKEAEAKVQELSEKLEEFNTKIRELKVQKDETATKIRESIENAFGTLRVQGAPINQPQSAKVREFSEAIEKKDWTKFREIADEQIRAGETHLREMMSRGGLGFDFEKHTTLKVRCNGRGFEIVPTAKTREVVESMAKTRDAIDANSMAESTLYQTNAMFADRYVPGITETFLKSDSLLKAMLKEQHIGGNDKYQWRLWIDFTTVTGTSTLSVDPNTTSVETTARKFEKVETPIREYRDGIEVTDFTQAHSMAAIGNLMEQEIMRAAEAVTCSMNADLFKPYGDATTGWTGFNGLLYIADSGTYTSYAGKTRSATNRLLDSTTANTYVTTAEDINVSVVRVGYEKVIAQGSNLADLAIVAHPTQVRRLFDSEDAAIRYKTGELAYSAAPPSWGFSRAMIPYLDGIPVIRDHYCTDVSGNADTFVVVDMGPQGFVLVVSKPLGMTGLAKVGTSEKAYVNFWGQAVYKRPRNIFLHDDLTTT